MKWNLRPASEFDRHEDQWRALNERGPNSQLLDPAFIGPLLEIFGTGRELLAIGGDEAIGLLTPKGLGRWETFQPSQAPLCAWIGPKSRETLNKLMRALPGVTLSIGVTQQDPDLAPRPDDLPARKTLDYIDTARITIDKTWDEYWQSRGRNLRKNMRRQRNRLEREKTTTRLETLTRPEEMAQAIADYGQLESKGWKAETGTAIHPDNAQGRFYRELLETNAQKDQAIVYRYFYNDALASSDLCIHKDGVLVILKTTYDEGIETSSPALLMREEAFPPIFQSGRFRRIEFYGKVMDWHTKWSDEIRRMYHVTAYRWAILPKLLSRRTAAL